MIMKKHSRFWSAFLAWLMVFALVPAAEVFATSKTQADAIAWVQGKVGQSLDMDGAYGAQCVDLILAYYDYLGVSRSSGNGADYAWNTLPSGWQRLQNAQPQKGDILVYSGNDSNPYGHVAIYESDNVTYHQNFNGHSYVEKVGYKYNGLNNPYWGCIRPNWNGGGDSTWPFTGVWAEKITNTDAEIHATISGRSITSSGFYLGISQSGMVKRHTESIGKYTENIWYDLTSECGITLYAGTTYYYRFFVIIDGAEYKSEIKTFTTTGSKVVSSISVKQSPTKTTYLPGEAFDPTGMILTATYEDGSTKDITSGYSYSPSVLNTVGRQAVTLSYGGKTRRLYVTVKFPVSITTQPADVSAVSGEKVTFTVAAEGSGLSYQWYYKKSGASDWSLWKSHTTATTTAVSNDTWNGMQVYCKVTDQNGYSVNSNTATITVTKALKITAHPSDISVKSGSTVAFTVVASGEGLQYQWYYKKSGATGWSLWKSHTTATTTATANDTWNGMKVYCKVTDSSGKSINSNAATITVTSSLAITQQPKNLTVTLGNSITLTVKASGSGLQYQWYFMKKGQTAWSKWNGRTHASETVTPNDTWDGIKLYCKVTDSSGKSVNSNAATITVSQPLKITQQPQSKTVKLGDSVTLSLKATGSGLQYQWYFMKSGAIEWSKWNGHTHATETVTPNATWDGIRLYCKVTDSTGKSVNSNSITVTLK